jgi:hypothetical protein
MLSLIAFLLFPLPLLSQYRFGKKVLSKTLKIPFIIVCLINLVFLVLISNWNFCIAVDKSGSAKEGVGAMLIGFTLTFALLISMIGQWVHRKSYIN